MDAPELPQVLKFDRERFLSATRDEKHDAEIAERVRQRVSVSTQSPAVAHYRNAVGVEKGLVQTLPTIFEQVADAMFWQGKFAAAAFITDDETKRAEFQAYDAAMQKLDAVVCMCPPIVTPHPHNAKGVKTSPYREIQRVFVGEIGKEVAFTRCQQCEGLFAQSVK